MQVLPGETFITSIDRRRGDVSDTVVESRKQQHCQAQARYREANRAVLRIQSWQYWLVPSPLFDNLI